MPTVQKAQQFQRIFHSASAALESMLRKLTQAQLSKPLTAICLS